MVFHKFGTLDHLVVEIDFGSFSHSSKIQNGRHGSHFYFLSKFCSDFSSRIKSGRDMGFSLYNWLQLTLYRCLFEKLMLIVKSPCLYYFCFWKSSPEKISTKNQNGCHCGHHGCQRIFFNAYFYGLPTGYFRYLC